MDATVDSRREIAMRGMQLWTLEGKIAIAVIQDAMDATVYSKKEIAMRWMQLWTLEGK